MQICQGTATEKSNRHWGLVIRHFVSMGVPSAGSEVARSVDSEDLQKRSVLHHSVRPDGSVDRQALNEPKASLDVDLHWVVSGTGTGDVAPLPDE